MLDPIPMQNRAHMHGCYVDASLSVQSSSSTWGAEIERDSGRAMLMEKHPTAHGIHLPSRPILHLLFLRCTRVVLGKLPPDFRQKSTLVSGFFVGMMMPGLRYGLRFSELCESPSRQLGRLV